MVPARKSYVAGEELKKKKSLSDKLFSLPHPLAERHVTTK